MRYVGFTTVTSSTHKSQLRNRYSVTCLNDLAVEVGPGYTLQPSIFWFDSQHLAHVERYLGIYSPVKTVPQELMALLGFPFVKAMVLKRGDFIEDRFGQMQRRTFIRLRELGAADAVIQRAARWFGSFLVWTRQRSGSAWSQSVSWIDPERAQGNDKGGWPAGLRSETKAEAPAAVGCSQCVIDDPCADDNDDEAKARSSLVLLEAGSATGGMEGSSFDFATDDDDSEEADRAGQNHRVVDDSTGDREGVDFTALVFVSHLKGRRLGLTNPNPGRPGLG